MSIGNAIENYIETTTDDPETIKATLDALEADFETAAPAEREAEADSQKSHRVRDADEADLVWVSRSHTDPGRLYITADMWLRGSVTIQLTPEQARELAAELERITGIIEAGRPVFGP